MITRQFRCLSWILETNSWSTFQTCLRFIFDSYDINELIIRMSQVSVINCDTLTMHTTQFLSLIHSTYFFFFVKQSSTGFSYTQEKWKNCLPEASGGTRFHSSRNQCLVTLKLLIPLILDWNPLLTSYKWSVIPKCSKQIKWNPGRQPIYRLFTPWPYVLGRCIYTLKFSGSGRKYPPYDVIHTCVCIYIVLNNDVIPQSLRNLTLIPYLPNLASVSLSLPAPNPMLAWNSFMPVCVCFSPWGHSPNSPFMGPRDLGRDPDRRDGAWDTGEAPQRPGASRTRGRPHGHEAALSPVQQSPLAEATLLFLPSNWLKAPSAEPPPHPRKNTQLRPQRFKANACARERRSLRGEERAGQGRASLASSQPQFPAA